MMRMAAEWTGLVAVGVPMAGAMTAIAVFALRAQAGRVGAVVLAAAMVGIGWRTEMTVDAPAVWVLIAAMVAGGLAALALPVTCCQATGSFRASR